MNRRAMPLPIRLAALTLVMLLAACSQPAPQPAEIKGVSLEGATIGGPFSLIDKAGQRVSSEQFKGKYRIVYFGYTFCPDACPTDVGVIMQGYLKFAKDHTALAAQVQPIFISIDPARDTPARIGLFTGAFSPKLLGLTGSQAEIDRVAGAFKVFKARGAQTAGGYLMEHTRQAFLLGRDGQPIEVLPTDLGPAAVAADLAVSVR